MRPLFLLLTLPFLLSGCVGTLVSVGAETGVSLAEDRSLGRKIDDTVLYTDITNQFLQADQGRLITDVTFNIRYARVMLTGTIASRGDAERAVALTWKAKGVEEVINELIITPDSSFLDTASDTLIKRNLESRLLLTKDVWVINYSMDVQNGIAYLIGRVKDRAELNRVLNVARTTKGVKRVVSHLQVRADLERAAPGVPAAANNAPAPAAQENYGGASITNTAPAYPATQYPASGAGYGTVDAPGSVSSTPLSAPAGR